MEPIKGGSLANIPSQAEEVLRELHPDWSPASWAIRFVASQKSVKIILSGMNDLAQIDANIHSVAAGPLNEEELATLRKAADIINNTTAIPCTSCRYCEAGCPQKIAIPSYFTLYNGAKRFPQDSWKLKPLYQELKERGGSPDSCIQCFSCERHCPQKIQITAWLERLQELFATL